jgi:FkbM family methyltransferase
MSLRQTVRRLVPTALKKMIRDRTQPWRISRLLSPFLPETICVDVGASHFPHTRWLVFLNSDSNCWLAVEPNSENLYYLKSWAWPSKVSACTTGLSQQGGVQTLFVTNVDTGSSLLPPEIPDSMRHRIADQGYFFPVREKRIETITLKDAVGNLPGEAPIFVKLDTQGTELSILQGAQALFDARRIVGIEMEATLLAQPIMRGSGKFWQASEFLERQGFELLHLKPIPSPPRCNRVRPELNTYLNECDAVFALRRDIAAVMPVQFRTALLAFYVTNSFLEEALTLLEQDKEVASFLNGEGCATAELLQQLQAGTK